MAKQKSSNDQLLELFKKADKDNSGSLTRDEVKKLFSDGNRNITDSQIDEMFTFFNTDGDQKIDFKEFKAGLEKIAGYMQEIEEAFKKFDKDGKGTLDRSEVKAALGECGQKYTDAEIDEFFREVDKDKSGCISLTEFIAIFT